MSIRFRHLIVVLLASLGLVGSLWSPVHADDVVIKVRVQNTPSEPGAKKQPVEGVTVIAVDDTGKEVAKGVTNAKGIADLTVASGPFYTIKLDTSTLPDGLALPDGDTGERNVEAKGGLGGNAAFNLGSAGPAHKTKLELLPQTLTNGIRFGLVIAIMSVGLSLIYATTGLSNFAHAETVTMGAVVTWTVNDHITIFDATTGVKALLQLMFAGFFGIAATALFSGLLETRVWRPMRRRRIGLTSMMIVSIGIAIFVRFFVQFRFGAQPKSFPQFSSQKNIEFGPIGVTGRDLTGSIISMLCLGGVAWMLLKTRTGKAIRAVSDNPELSSSTGINTDRIILFVWMLGGALAGLSGILFGLDEQVQWNMGSRLLLLMFAAITLGGLGRPFGALVGSLAVGLTVQLWAWYFDSFTDLKNVGALAALIIILLVRPQGILGKKERVG